MCFVDGGEVGCGRVIAVGAIAEDTEEGEVR